MTNVITVAQPNNRTFLLFVEREFNVLQTGALKALKDAKDEVNKVLPDLKILPSEITIIHLGDEVRDVVELWYTADLGEIIGDVR